MGIDGIEAKLELSTPDDNKLVAEVLFKYSILTAFAKTVYIPVKNIYDEYLKTHVAPDRLATNDDILEEVRELADKSDVMPYVDEIIVGEESGDLSFDIPTTLKQKLDYYIINKATNLDYELNSNLSFEEQLSVLSNALPY